MSCIDLTPAIKKELTGMKENEILEVICNDPTAKEGIPAWCRLTGNTLLEHKEINTTESAFYIQKNK
jgi:tRNA 2-thiouridine synthesizing protein A